MASAFSRLSAVAVAVTALSGCDGEPVIEGLYLDRSIVLSSTCGDVGNASLLATVQVQEDAVVIDLAAPTFGRSTNAATILRLNPTSDITVIDDDDASCGVPGSPVVSAVVTGAAAVVTGAAAPATSNDAVAAPSPPGFRRHETLERLASADNVLRLRQTLRFDGVDVCVDGRVPTVPPRDCELVRVIDLRLLEACPAERQRTVPLRLGEATFCSVDDES